LGLRSIANLALGKGIRFQAKAYWLLPFWLLSEIFSGFLFGKSSGVAHWAHVGGFIFGGLAALGLRYSGLEQIADKAIEAKVSWTADPAIVTATEDMSQGRVDSAIATLKTFVTGKPDSVEGLTLLHQAQWRKNDLPGYRDSICKLIQVHLKNQNLDGALQEYQDFKNSGGEALPSATWLELCRAIEGQGNHERAVEEFASPGRRAAVLRNRGEIAGAASGLGNEYSQWNREFEKGAGAGSRVIWISRAESKQIFKFRCVR
jgi:hypothetical protein